MATALGQMMGGGGMGSAGGPAGGGSAAGMMGSNGMMAGGMGNGMMNDLTVGPDGTVYVVRPVQAQVTMMPGSGRQVSVKQELAAISAADGSVRWKLELTGSHVSQPVVGKDGKLFLSLDEGQMMSQGQQADKSRFLVITATATAATIAANVQVDSDVLGAPQMASTGAGAADYVIYVTGMEMANMRGNPDDRDTIPAGEKTLYGFLPDGRLKIKVKIGEAMVGARP